MRDCAGLRRGGAGKLLVLYVEVEIFLWSVCKQGQAMPSICWSHWSSFWIGIKLYLSVLWFNNPITPCLWYNSENMPHSYKWCQSRNPQKAWPTHQRVYMWNSLLGVHVVYFFLDIKLKYFDKWLWWPMKRRCIGRFVGNESLPGIFSSLQFLAHKFLFRFSLGLWL